MDAEDVISRIRDHYIKQFRQFLAGQRAACSEGSAEVKMHLNDTSGLYQDFYCVDFVRYDDGQEVFEFNPGSFLSFEPIYASFGRTEVTIESLRWDAAVIMHDLTELPDDRLADWFRHWFDSDDVRHDPEAELSEIIHSLRIQDDSLSIDFGSAPVEAFWGLLHILEAAGATEVKISSPNVGEVPSGARRRGE